MTHADTRRQWREVSQAYDQVEAALRLMLGATTIADLHTAKQGLLGSLIALREATDGAALELCNNTVFVEQSFAPLPVTCYLPDIIDIESEEDPPCPTTS